MVRMNSRYPDNWNAIASQVKVEAQGLCQRCGWVCDGSSRDRFLQVHHWDMRPENNGRSNLVALCPRCHLDLHRGDRGNVSEGQMVLFLYFQRAILPVEVVKEQPVEHLELFLGENLSEK